MTDIFEVADWVSSKLKKEGFVFAFIGGVALQAWGEPRVTRDVDLTVLIGFGNEESRIAELLKLFPARIDHAFEHAVANRVLLCRSESGIGIDIGLAAFPFEEEMLSRQKNKEYLPGITLPIIGAEDLVIMKTFAGRDQDWIDLRGILVRQGREIDWNLIDEVLPGLLDLIEATGRLGRLEQLREETSK